MSKSITGSIKTVIMSIVIGLLLVSLAIWGVSDAFTPQTKDAAAMVGKEKITLLEFDTYFKRRLREENQTQAKRLTTKQAYARGFHNAVLNQLVTEKLLQLDADDLGVNVNRRDARAYVEGMEVFNNEITGKLDESKMVRRLAQSDTRTSRKQFENNVFKALRQEQTIKSITAGIIAPQNYSEQQYQFLTEQRKVKFLHLTAGAVPTLPNPSDEDLKAFIDENATSYIAPEYRRFTMLRIETTDILPDMTASDEEIADQYDYKIEAGLLGTEETRSIIQIVAGDEEKAGLVTAAINSGKTVDAVVAEFGLEKPVIYKDVLATATSDPKTGEFAFTLDAKDTQTLEGSFGTWYSVMVSDITPAIVPSLADEQNSISLEIRTEKAKKFIYDAQDKIQSGLDEGSTLEEVAKANGISAASYDFISRIGDTQSGQKMTGTDVLAGISNDDTVLKEIFTSDAGFEGDLFETKTKGIAAIRVDEIKDSTQRGFADVKEQALKSWHFDQTNKALGTLLDELAERVSNGETLDAIAASIETGGNILEEIMLRIVQTPLLGQQLSARMFEARIGRIVRGTGANGIDRIIGKVTEITANPDTLIGGGADSLREQMEKSINSDIQQAYHTAILKTYPARTMQDNITKVLGIDQ